MPRWMMGKVGGVNWGESGSSEALITSLHNSRWRASERYGIGKRARERERQKKTREKDECVDAAGMVLSSEWMTEVGIS